MTLDRFSKQCNSRLKYKWKKVQEGYYDVYTTHNIDKYKREYDKLTYLYGYEINSKLHGGYNKYVYCLSKDIIAISSRMGYYFKVTDNMLDELVKFYYEHN